MQNLQPLSIQVDSTCFIRFASDLWPLPSPTSTKLGPRIRSLVHNHVLVFVLCKSRVVYVAWLYDCMNVSKVVHSFSLFGEYQVVVVTSSTRLLLGIDYRVC